MICGAVRGFAGVGFFERIRRRPCTPLLALLHRRLLRFRPQRMASRTATAEAAIAALSHVRRPGCRAALHSHWVFPIRTPEPDHLMHRLWKAGFDATRGASSLHVVEAPPERPEAVPERAEEAIHELLYLPVYPGLTAQALAKLAKEITTTAGTARMPSSRARLATSG